jgi:hypothetical protein
MESANRKPIVQSGFKSQKSYRLDSIRDRHIRHERDRRATRWWVGSGGAHADVIGIEIGVMMLHSPQASREFVG